MKGLDVPERFGFHVRHTVGEFAMNRLSEPDGRSHSPADQGATLESLDENWDVVVVGAGIAGGTAARLFAASGLRVLLVERSSFPRYKVCGSCLNARALSYLSRSGMDINLLSHGAVPLQTVRISAGNNVAMLQLPGGLAVSRALLDQSLAEAASNAGAVFLSRTLAELGRSAGTSRVVRLSRAGVDREVCAKLVIAADGLHGGVLQRLGESQMRIAPHSRVGLGCIVERGGSACEPGTIYMSCGPSGYAGVVCIEEGKLAIAAALDPAMLKTFGGPHFMVQSLLAQSGVPEIPSLSSAMWKGTPPLTRCATQFSAPRVLVLGDARGYVEPFTGEGMAWALESAHNATNLALGATGNFGSNLESSWNHITRKSIRNRSLVCRAVSATLRSTVATRILVSMLAVSPGLSGPFLARMNAETRS